MMSSDVQLQSMEAGHLQHEGEGWQHAASVQRG